VGSWVKEIGWQRSDKLKEPRKVRVFSGKTNCRATV
jgi:hypothetical protein